MAKLTTKDESIRVVVVGDHQVPFHNTPAIRLARQIIKDIDPHKIVNVGDCADLPNLSTKFVHSPEFANQVRSVRTSVRDIVEKDKAAAPGAEYIWIDGNHEKRLSDFIAAKVPELWELTAPGEPLNILQYLNVADLVDTHVTPYGAHYVQTFGNGGRFLFYHGARATKYSAHGELTDHMRSGISGHTHRFQMAFQNGFDSVKGWWSNGTLANIRGPLTPPGFHGGNDLKNQQQGITVVTFDMKRNLFGVEPVVFATERTCVFRGKSYIERGGK
jgi:hypothetical protein